MRIEKRIPTPVTRCIEVVQIIAQDMLRCDLLKHASAMAYVTLLSLIPSLAATFGLISLFKPVLGQESEFILKIKHYILQNLATGTGEQVVHYIDGFLANLDFKKIGLSGVAGILISLILLLRQIELALNRIWMVSKPRNIFRRFIYFWTFVTLGTLIVGMAIGLSSGFHFSALNPFNSKDMLPASVWSHVTPFIATTLFFTLLYKIVPNTYVSTWTAFKGALPAAFLFVIVGKFYGWYAAHFNNYQVIYGALAALPLFLVWLYILWVIILLGALLSWRFQQSFDLSDELDEQELTLTPAEKLRNHKLHTYIPYLCLLAICEKFLTGVGKGITLTELMRILNIPRPWIEESISFLKEAGFIHRASDNDDEDPNTCLQYVPAVPVNQLNRKGYFKQIEQLVLSWLTDWHSEGGLDFKSELTALAENELNAVNETQLDRVINQLRLHARDEGRKA